MENEQRLEFEFDPHNHICAAKISPDIIVGEEVNKLRADLVENDLYREFEDWCTDDCLRRYLAAKNFDGQKARELLLSSLQWRKLRHPHQHCSWDPNIMEGGRTGKVYLPGFDRWGRSIIILNNSVENSKNPDDIMEYMAFNFDFALREMELSGKAEKYVVFVQMSNFSFFNTPHFTVSLESLQMLGPLYPERLGHLIIFQGPAVLNIFIEAMRPFADEKIFSKMVTISGSYEAGSQNDRRLSYLIGPNWKTLTGTDQPEWAPKSSPGYNYAEYWPNLISREKKMKGISVEEDDDDPAETGTYKVLPGLEPLDDEFGTLSTVVMPETNFLGCVRECCWCGRKQQAY